MNSAFQIQYSELLDKVKIVHRESVKGIEIYGNKLEDLKTIKEYLINLKEENLDNKTKRDVNIVLNSVVGTLQIADEPLPLNEIFFRVNMATNNKFKKSNHLASRLKVFSDKGLILRKKTNKGFVYSIKVEKPENPALKISGTTSI